MIEERKIKLSNGEYKVNIETYNTAQDVVKDIQQRKYTCNDFKENQEDRSYDKYWCGVGSLNEALDLLKNGYQINVSKFDKDLKSNLQGDGKRFAFRNNVCGFAPIVPLSILNVPNCMIDMTTKPIKTKVIDIVYNNSCNAGTSSDTILKCGQKLLSAIVQLEMEGYRFNLYSTQIYSDSCSSDVLKVRVKSANQPLDIKRCAFPLMHTAFFRAIGFEWYSKTPNGTFRYGYGRELKDSVSKIDYNKVIDGIYGDKSVFISLPDIRDKGVEQIKEILKYDKRNKS